MGSVGIQALPYIFNEPFRKVKIVKSYSVESVLCLLY